MALRSGERMVVEYSVAAKIWSTTSCSVRVLRRRLPVCCQRNG
jgi:hypothetical protein